MPESNFYYINKRKGEKAKGIEKNSSFEKETTKYKSMRDRSISGIEMNN